MKNSKLIKMFLVMVVSVCVAFVATNVFATDDGFVDLTNTVVSNIITDNNTTIDNNTTLDENVNVVNNTTNTNLSSNSITITNNTSNTSSSYNTNTNTNTNLPATGIDGTGTTIALIVVLAISGIYAYKKVIDYKNI